MSSLRNAVQRRNHRERAQPREREKWGLLEKHKDYSLRAKDFNAKKAKLRSLRQKAADRNPDEFHFAMMSTQTSKGVKLADRGNKSLSVDVVKLLKTQDVGYLRTMLQRVRREREKLEEALQILDGEDSELRVLKEGQPGKGKHAVFVDSVDEQKGFAAESWFGTDQEGLRRIYNRPRKASDSVDAPSDEELEDVDGIQDQSRSKHDIDVKTQDLKEQRVIRKQRKRAQAAQLSRLEGVKMRERDLLVALEETEEQRARMSNTIGGINKKGVKFRVRERKC